MSKLRERLKRILNRVLLTLLFVLFIFIAYYLFFFPNIEIPPRRPVLIELHDDTLSIKLAGTGRGPDVGIFILKAESIPDEIGYCETNGINEDIFTYHGKEYQILWCALNRNCDLEVHRDQEIPMWIGNRWMKDIPLDEEVLSCIQDGQAFAIWGHRIKSMNQRDIHIVFNQE